MLEEFETKTKKLKLHIRKVDKCFLDTYIQNQNTRKTSTVKDTAKIL